MLQRIILVAVLALMTLSFLFPMHKGDGGRGRDSDRDRFWRFENRVPDNSQTGVEFFWITIGGVVAYCFAEDLKRSRVRASASGQ